MYAYRQLTPEQRAMLVQERKDKGYPLHSPPHFKQAETFYLLTATCYNHACHMLTEKRRQTIMTGLFNMLDTTGIEIHAMAVLPNHYHFLAYVPQFLLLSGIFRLLHGSTANAWNVEDGQRGRKVWYRYTDRAIRSDRHYYTTMNYIHYNAVKHKWVSSPYDWKESSIHWYLDQAGREWLRDLWVEYPIRNYGKGWDDIIDNASGS